MNTCRKVSRSHKKKRPGYKKKKPRYKQKSHCNSFQSYKSKPSYGKKPKYKKKKHHRHRLFDVAKKPFGHHVHIDSGSKAEEMKKVVKQSHLGLMKNNQAFLAGHSATWLGGFSHQAQKRRRQRLKSTNGPFKAGRKNGRTRTSSSPRILKDSVRGNKRIIHIGI